MFSWLEELKRLMVGWSLNHIKALKPHPHLHQREVKVQVREDKEYVLYWVGADRVRGLPATELCLLAASNGMSCGFTRVYCIPFVRAPVSHVVSWDVLD